MIYVVLYITIWALKPLMNTYQGDAEPTNGEIIPNIKLAK